MKKKDHNDDSIKEPKIGVYVCHCGGNISDVVDVQRLANEAGKFSNVVVSRDNMFMCSDPGQNMIAEDIEKEGLDRVVIAACSPSLHETTFRKTLERVELNPYLYEHVNIREQVSWCSKGDPVGATEKSKKLVLGAIGKAEKLKPLNPIRVDARQHIAIIGGGISGLRAAHDLSKHRLKVTLVEQSPFLGGRIAQLENLYPTGEKARDLLNDLLTKVTSDENITIYTSTDVVNSSGFIGNFHLDLKINPRGITESFDLGKLDSVINSCPEKRKNEFDYNLTERKAIHLPYKRCYPEIPAIDWDTCNKCEECKKIVGQGIELNQESKTIGVDVGSIIVATGFDHYEPSEGEYGYQEYPQVITLPQFNRMLDHEGPYDLYDEVKKRPIKNICFIHCVGSRQREGINKPQSDGKVNDYCSRVCCTATLQAACEFKKLFPDVNVYDFYQDIRTYGRGHEDYYEEASRLGVTFFRWIAENPPIVKSCDQKRSPIVIKVNDTLTFNQEIEVPADLVVLSTGMMPRNISPLVDMLKLPRSADRFLQEVHPKLRPVELSIAGIMIAGTCQAPMDVNESTASASTAAVKSAILLGKGYIELDPFVANVNQDKCTAGEGCDAICVKECSNMQAISLVEKEVNNKIIKVIEVNKALCKGCGMCVAVCPARAIDVDGWQLDQFEAIVDAIVS